MNLREIIENAHMAGQQDAGIDAGYSNARAYCNKVLKELKINENYDILNEIRTIVNDALYFDNSHDFKSALWTILNIVASEMFTNEGNLKENLKYSGN
jgi:hypothetical protein